MLLPNRDFIVVATLLLSRTPSHTCQKLFILVPVTFGNVLVGGGIFLIQSGKPGTLQKAVRYLCVCFTYLTVGAHSFLNAQSAFHCLDEAISVVEHNIFVCEITTFIRQNRH